MRGCEYRGKHWSGATMVIACLGVGFDVSTLHCSASFEELVDKFPIDDYDGSSVHERLRKLEGSGHSEERVKEEHLEVLWELMVRRYLGLATTSNTRLESEIEAKVPRLSQNERETLGSIYEASQDVLCRCFNAAVSGEDSHTDVFLGLLNEDQFSCLRTEKENVTEWRVHPHLVNLIKEPKHGDMVKDLIKKSILERHEAATPVEAPREHRIPTDVIFTCVGKFLTLTLMGWTFYTRWGRPQPGMQSDGDVSDLPL